MPPTAAIIPESGRAPVPERCPEAAFAPGMIRADPASERGRQEGISMILSNFNGGSINLNGLDFTVGIEGKNFASASWSVAPNWGGGSDE